MSDTRESMHGEWSSRWAFVLAATGAAVGLGNIWKFPYIAGVNGGGAFVLVYLLFVVIIGVPLLMAEIFIGRAGRQNPASTMRDLALESGASRHWQIVGAIGIAAGFLILSYYSVIAGWALDYVFQAASGRFDGASVEHIHGFFSDLVSDPLELIIWHSIIIITTVLIVVRGVEKGLEKAIYFMFPLMAGLLLILLGYSFSTAAFSTGLRFLFQPNFHELTPAGALSALGHAFFTLSLATGSIMMYGAYLPKKASVTTAAICIAAADTFVAILASLIIFPIVFAHAMEPAKGPGLIFHTLPIAFSQMPYGTFFATLFFVMLVFAALTSAISLIEPTVAWAIERFNTSRTKATCVIGFLIWFLGLGSVLSFNHWENIKWFGLNFFDLLDYITSNIMLPLGGLFIAIFASWFMKPELALKELNPHYHWRYRVWRACTRYMVPIAIGLVFLSILGVV